MPGQAGRFLGEDAGSFPVQARRRSLPPLLCQPRGSFAGEASGEARAFQALVTASGLHITDLAGVPRLARRSSRQCSALPRRSRRRRSGAPEAWQGGGGSDPDEPSRGAAGKSPAAPDGEVGLSRRAEPSGKREGGRVLAVRLKLPTSSRKAGCLRGFLWGLLGSIWPATVGNRLLGCRAFRGEAGRQLGRAVSFLGGAALRRGQRCAQRCFHSAVSVLTAETEPSERDSKTFP